MSEELTTEQVVELRTALVAECSRLEALLELFVDGSLPVKLDTAIGRLSRMDAIQQQEMTRASRSTLETKRRQVEASLAAFEKESYGTCRLCEGAIGYARLKARPEAPFCLRCQDARER